MTKKMTAERKELIAKRPVKKELTTGFTDNQLMSKGNFEIYYYNDSQAEPVSWHQHDHYEFYFFLEGNMDYQVEDTIYPLEYGDFLLVPPHIKHRPIFHDNAIPYRRFVLWISESYFQSLCEYSKEFSYYFDTVHQQKSYHTRPDYIQLQELQARLTDLIEESRSGQPFCELNAHLMLCQFLVYINRLTYDRLHAFTATSSNILYLNVCAYINSHLNESLSLDSLAAHFFVSKYYISHVFKDNMGISLHQYILKKRLHVCKNAILSGQPLGTLFQQYGFSDYSSFYRAFRKEYGVSPTDFKEKHRLPDA